MACDCLSMSEMAPIAGYSLSGSDLKMKIRIIFEPFIKEPPPVAGGGSDVGEARAAAR